MNKFGGVDTDSTRWNEDSVWIGYGTDQRRFNNLVFLTPWRGTFTADERTNPERRRFDGMTILGRLRHEDSWEATGRHFTTGRDVYDEWRAVDSIWGVVLSTGEMLFAYGREIGEPFTDHRTNGPQREDTL